MLPCTGAARSSSYRGAKILGKKWTALDKAKFGLAVHSLIKKEKPAQGAAYILLWHAFKLLFPSSKGSNAKMHNYS